MFDHAPFGSCDLERVAEAVARAGPDKTETEFRQRVAIARTIPEEAPVTTAQGPFARRYRPV